ncbi:HEPN domain-containing protein, partial [Haloparvum sedimenti]|uniref:HEPN domain-containing protein n=1 Tax=Haloparvum sedimenti TaxID=1678448 RepID=UPI001C3FFDC9
GVVFQQNAYPENKLMNLCHGLESYHRKRFMETYMSESDYDSVYNDLVNLIKGDPSNVYNNLDSSDENIRDKHNIPTPFVQSLKDGTIKHANKMSLRKRLQQLIRATEPVISDLPYSIVGKHEQVADTRNYFAHRTQDLKRKATLGAGLTSLNWGIQQLIEACLLLEIGIEPDHIKNRLHSKYNAKSVTTH